VITIGLKPTSPMLCKKVLEKDRGHQIDPMKIIGAYATEVPNGRQWLIPMASC
jgi:hypothetical protein